ncbi:hypothetical protein T440DRAFT_484418 [Plenodomus tracheiphilus IPT5]|uniref:Rhodopsin domain-containing protein n=1 Tax=Plenodomus tracheiphilus IPT5 TaxID=1408161 RepID=A0A6A7APB0_9PLEO|nr:hypothetical protein T440DRAFT_484418 [Plenodomus tracheiphilus IPT5]
MWGSMFASISNGLGQIFNVLDDTKISSVQQKFFACQITFYIALALSKCSTLVLLQAVFERDPKVSHVAHGAMALVAVWGLLSVLAVSVGCSPDTVIPKTGDDHCSSLVPWLKAVVVVDVVTEMVIILLPMIGFYGTLMPVRRRATVMLAFSTRLPNIVFSLLYLIAYSKFINHQEPAIDIVATAAWQNLLLSYNLMSATIPSLKGFTQGFMTAGLSLGYARDTATEGGSISHHTYELRSMSNSRSIATVPPHHVPDCKPTPRCSFRSRSP